MRSCSSQYFSEHITVDRVQLENDLITAFDLGGMTKVRSVMKGGQGC